MIGSKVILSRSNDRSSVVSDLSDHVYNRVSYSWDVWMRYQCVNNICPPKIREIMTQPVAGFPDISRFAAVASSIIETIRSGEDANIVVIKNEIRQAMNKISFETFDKFANVIKNQMHSHDTMHFIATELVRLVVSCEVSFVKNGIAPGPVPDDSKTTPHISIDLMRHFFNEAENEDSPFNTFSFKKKLRAYCQETFSEYVSEDIKLDENNEATVNAYKGLMTCLGMMYSAGLMSNNALIDCINSVVGEMTRTGEDGVTCVRKPFECRSYLSGYMLLMPHVIYTLTNMSDEEFSNKSADIARILRANKTLLERNEVCRTVAENGKVGKIISSMDGAMLRMRVLKQLKEVEDRLSSLGVEF